jgi:outer membrane lipase/esterase
VLLAYNGSDANLGRFLAGSRGARSQADNGLWIDGFGQWGDQKGTQGVTGYDYTLWGSTIGYDHTFPNNLMLGVSVGISRAVIDFDESTGDGSVKDVIGSLYGSYLSGNAYIEGIFSYGRERYYNHRHLSIGAIQRDALSNHNGNAYSVYLGAGYNFNVNNSAITPFATLRYAHLDEDGFAESGAGSLDLTVDPRRTDSLVSELGIRAAHEYRLTNGSLIPEFSAAFSYDFDIDDRVITSSFAGSPGAVFSVKGQEVDKYGAVVSAGLTFIHKSGFSSSLKYTGEFRARDSSQGVLGELRYIF